MGQDSKVNEPARNDWISPYFVLTFHHSKCAGQAQAAISSIGQNAFAPSRKGPWTVINKQIMSPDGDARAYVSWAPYWWPNCCEDAQGDGPGSNMDVKKRQLLSQSPQVLLNVSVSNDTKSV
jgi:hypothetical protein